MYNPQIHNRRSIRLKNYDYSEAGLYFITLGTASRKHIFGKIEKGEMQLNILGKIANEEWLKTISIRKNISLGAYIIMPNHFHAIISIDYKLNKDKNPNTGKFISPSQTIGAIIRGYKGATTKRINNLIREINDNPSQTGELQFTQKKQKFTKETGELQFAPDSNKKTLEENPLPNIYLSGKGSIWQRNYHDIIIRNEKAYLNITNYIYNNPKNWEKDKLKT